MGASIFFSSSPSPSLLPPCHPGFCFPLAHSAPRPPSGTPTVLFFVQLWPRGGGGLCAASGAQSAGKHLAAEIHCLRHCAPTGCSLVLAGPAAHTYTHGSSPSPRRTITGSATTALVPNSDAYVERERTRSVNGPGAHSTQSRELTAKVRAGTGGHAHGSRQTRPRRLTSPCRPP